MRRLLSALVRRHRAGAVVEVGQLLCKPEGEVVEVLWRVEVVAEMLLLGHRKFTSERRCWNHKHPARRSLPLLLMYHPRLQ